MKLYSYLYFNGNCQEAFLFYEKYLGGKITAMMSYGDSPVAGEVPAEQHSAIMHARMAIGGTELMASDAILGRFDPIQSSCLSLTVPSPEEAERIYAALAPDGEIVMPLQETFWALRFGMLRDRFGVLWMVNAEKPMSSAT
jgi:PhnB protein